MGGGLGLGSFSGHATPTPREIVDVGHGCRGFEGRGAGDAATISIIDNDDPYKTRETFPATADSIVCRKGGKPAGCGNLAIPARNCYTERP